MRGVGGSARVSPTQAIFVAAGGGSTVAGGGSAMDDDNGDEAELEEECGSPISAMGDNEEESKTGRTKVVGGDAT